ncbi:MAG TPA: homocysteine S-methyltransferase family protein, partial [Desulfosarcina sp.]|nr:homocysteine S-methyltransferase family protein [Desulfosarcina sp.]
MNSRASESLLFKAVGRWPAVLAEGAVIERLRRETALALDPLLLNTALIYSRSGRSAMGRIYTQYLAIAAEYRLPMLLAAPTWRANPERVRRAGLGTAGQVNRDAVRFIREVCARAGEAAAPVLIGGLMACRGDAYRPDEALSADAAEAFHRPQASCLAEAGVDYIMAATLPALSEAMGLARVLSGLPAPYVISFIIGRDGALLDGTPLAAAVDRTDREVDPRPAFYMLNCVHPQTVIEGLGTATADDGLLKGRLLGIQANTSTQRPEALDGSEALDGAEPEGFADDVLALHDRFGMKILGGCCGTDHRHIRA